jgi:MoaA/NifB/PqqE/SkfB family radical SAM enzyme
MIDQSKKFPEKYKVIHFGGLGEPLLHPRLPEMIERAHEVTNRIELFSNASLLTPALSDSIINAGLTRIKIAIQGIDALKYRKNCSVQIDFNKFVENIKYFYDRSRGEDSIPRTIVYIKIMEEQLEDENDRKEFYRIFGDICDEIYVEHLAGIHPAVSDKYSERINSNHVYGEKRDKLEVCPFPFYFLLFNSEGDGFPCCILSLPKYFSIGNVNTKRGRIARRLQRLYLL